LVHCIAPHARRGFGLGLLFEFHWHLVVVSRWVNETTFDELNFAGGKRPWGFLGCRWLNRDRSFELQVVLQSLIADFEEWRFEFLERPSSFPRLHAVLTVNLCRDLALVSELFCSKRAASQVAVWMISFSGGK
jgi:hypothetical protein